MYLRIIFFLIPILIPIILVVTSIILSKNIRDDKEKSSPFECGFDPLCSSRTTLTVRFYLIAIIFLIFDVEIVLILPLILTKPTNSKFWLITLTLFLIILIVGLFYEWSQGTFNWSGLLQPGARQLPQRVPGDHRAPDDGLRPQLAGARPQQGSARPLLLDHSRHRRLQLHLLRHLRQVVQVQGDQQLIALGRWIIVISRVQTSMSSELCGDGDLVGCLVG